MKDAKSLLEKYKAGKCTEDEKLLVHKWFHHLDEDQLPGFTEADLKNVRKRLWGNLYQLTNPVGIRSLWPRLIAAAVILLVISTAIYFYLEVGKIPAELANKAQLDATPGGNKATLTLSDGSKISLTDATNGELAQQSGIKIVKAADGQLIYSILDKGIDSEVVSYNTIETPVGGQYQINLPDGSKVWLNSASSLRYPVRFTGNDRKVEITGEAYFEVFHKESMPFKVITASQTVEVLGTHFNVMAYPDESSINTTLIQGSVKVIKDQASRIILPGQQTRVRNGKIAVYPADIDEVTAWKEGYFVFKDQDIETIMRQISRWYNIGVEYRGHFSGKTFGGKISRSRNVSEVIEILESMGALHFDILPGDSENERRIVVMP